MRQTRAASVVVPLTPATGALTLAISSSAGSATVTAAADTYTCQDAPTTSAGSAEVLELRTRVEIT